MSLAAAGPWSVQFRRERQAAWTELERLVERAEAVGAAALPAADLARLPVLYRAAVSSLGVARSAVLDQALRDYLEALVARAYLVVYTPKRTFGEVLGEFALRGFPSAVWSIRRQVAVSAALTVLGALLAFAMVRADSATYALFLDEAYAGGRSPASSTEDLRRTLFGGGDQDLLTFAAFLFTHNASIGIMTYGIGFALGLPAALLLVYNGMILGAMSALFHERGLAVEWWSWVLPHGVTELLAIVLCGAAGLAVGQTLLFPGRYGRIHALTAVGRRMGAVVAGCVVMLLLAGFVEGVFRQTVQSVPVRYLLAGVFATLWILYFAFVGRRATTVEAP